jgi:signal transduction histidine kinase
VDALRASGVDVTLERHGAPLALGAGLEVSAYRIVQEALTNVVKHAGPARVTVAVEQADGELRLEITDDGLGSPVGAAGRGLLGMRERAGSLGGTVTAGPVPGGGWTVRAVLPLSAVPQR